MPNATEDEAVRIFVEYTNTAQAIKAVVALNGRYFAGRSVKAGFYPPDVFSSKEYGRWFDVLFVSLFVWSVVLS